MATLSIFANFFIDTDERFQRMRDSFFSFHQAQVNKWVVNVRGRYSEEVLDFLRLHLCKNLVSYRLHSKEGWFFDTRKMLDVINSDYVLFWLEDHVNLGGVDLLMNIVSDMNKYELDYMLYSFWQRGRLRERYTGVLLQSGSYLDYFEHNVTNNQIIQSNLGGYLISAASICRLSLFRRLILADDPVPKRWHIELPFDFEKAPTDEHWLPLRVGILRQELFASIDDDHGEEGSCLISRGLYPLREQRQSYATGRRLGAKEQTKAFAMKLYGFIIPDTLRAKAKRFFI